MRSGRRLARLWIIATVFWLAYWAWIYTSKCIHARNGILFCPADGDPTTTTIIRTNELRFWAMTVLAPFWVLVVGLLLWWALQGFQRQKDKPRD
jgi:hypothetical protein